MANTVQIKRGSNASVNAHTGPSGEIIYNLETGRLHAQDGSTAGGKPHALVSDVDLKANAAVNIGAGTGLTGGGTLAASRTLALNSTSIASLAKADTAVQPAITITAGTGLTGGGTLAANRTVALNPASIASLAKADSALQAPGGTAGQILAKNSATTNDVVWVSSEAATAVSYGPQTLTAAQQVQARQNIQADHAYDTIAIVTAANVPAYANAIRTNGYTDPGDGGGALYKRVATEPSHAGKVQSADGAWWEECPQHSALSFTNLLQDTSSLYAYGANNGWFLGYDLKGGMSFKVYQSENVMDTGGPGAFRDGLYVQHVDGDTTDYGTPQRRVISNGARVLANGKYTNSGGWEAQTKDIVALDAHAVGRITGWNDRGVSGVAAGAIQYGSGIASNEFAAENSVYANEQSVSMAAVQAILRPHKGAADVTHKYRAVLASNSQGYEATAAFEAYSTAHPTEPARNGAFKIGLELAGVNATEAGIRMPRTGVNGGLIDYDANDYSRYDRTVNRFDFVIGGSFVMSWTSFGVAIGGQASGDARLKIPSSTGSGPHLRLVPGGTPSAPQDGDIWFDGQLRVRIGGVTKTVTVT